MLFRTIWLSDIHLGTRGCRADKVLEFLRDHDAETIYLVGDIIDGWRLSRRFYWPQSHNDIIQKLLRKARKGTRVVYVAGNHDEFLRPFVGNCFGNIELVNEIVHVTADQRRLLVLHGDAFDYITTCHPWLAVLGDFSYMVMLVVNQWLAAVRHHFGYGYWSLSAYLKHKIKQAANFISKFEEAVAHECTHRGFDGVVCGHIHHPEIRPIGNITYHNCGDTVESCTALVEDFNGNISIISLLNHETNHLSY